MSRSRTGPQMSVWQKPGVATSSTVGVPVSSASVRVIWWKSQGMARVQMVVLVLDVAVKVTMPVQPAARVPPADDAQRHQHKRHTDLERALQPSGGVNARQH